MPDYERKGNSPPPEPPDKGNAPPSEPPGGGDSSPAGPPEGRWWKRFRRLRDEAGISLVRGASTAVGGLLITYGAVWLQR